MIVAAIVTIIVIAFALGLLFGVTNWLLGDGDFLGPATFWFFLFVVALLVMWGAGQLIWWVWSVAS